MQFHNLFSQVILSHINTQLFGAVILQSISNKWKIHKFCKVYNNCTYTAHFAWNALKLFIKIFYLPLFWDSLGKKMKRVSHIPTSSSIYIITDLSRQTTLLWYSKYDLPFMVSITSHYKYMATYLSFIYRNPLRSTDGQWAKHTLFFLPPWRTCCQTLRKTIPAGRKSEIGSVLS